MTKWCILAETGATGPGALGVGQEHELPHGVASEEPWFIQVIEPNLAGATAIAEHWYSLLRA